MVKISTRGHDLPASPIRKLKPYADQAIEAGKIIYHLNIGQPDIDTPFKMLEALKNFDNKFIPYGPSQGLPEYQDALIKYYAKYDINLTRSDVIVTNGGSEAIIMAFTVCLDDGDEVLIPEPFYANYNGFAVATGVVVKPITTRIENDWQLPPASEIEKMITPKTKAIMICNPNNPTGKVYGREELSKIVAVAVKHKLFLLADEVYREFIFNKDPHVSLMHFPEALDLVVMMDSISKRFSACGSRIGAFISKNKDVMSAALRYGQARLCPPTIDQIMAIPSVELGQDYYDETLAEYKARRDCVLDALAKMNGVQYKVPNGAFYIIVKLPVQNAENFVKWLLTDFDVNGETVMLAPAAGFYNTPGMGEDEIRIAFVLNAEKTKKAMNIFKLGLEKYKTLHK